MKLYWIVYTPGYGPFCTRQDWDLCGVGWTKPSTSVMMIIGDDYE